MTSANGGDAYQEAQAVAREIREHVADQVHDLVIEREGLGSLDEIGPRARRIGTVMQQVVQARGRQRQADEYGLPKAVHVAAEREALDLLRESVLSLAEACGSAVVGLDYKRQSARFIGGV